MHCNIHIAIAKILRLVVSNTWIIIEYLACLLNKWVVTHRILVLEPQIPLFLGTWLDFGVH